MTSLIQLSTEQLQARIETHTGGQRPHLPHVLISHVCWQKHLSFAQVHQALLDQRPTQQVGPDCGRHLIIDGIGGFWIDADHAWRPAADGFDLAAFDSGTGHPVRPVYIDMSVSADNTPVALKLQLQSVATAMSIIGEAFQLDDVPSVRWRSIRLNRQPAAAELATFNPATRFDSVVQRTGT